MVMARRLWMTKKISISKNKAGSIGFILELDKKGLIIRGIKDKADAACLQPLSCLDKSCIKPPTN
jgi:hypothetical protein